MTKLVAAVILGLTLGVSAQDQGRYRDFQLGTSLASVSALTGTPISDARLIHERPVLMQELRWIPSQSTSVPQAIARGAMLQQVVFSFYEDQLSLMMIDYDRFRTAGMTDGDMIQSLSVVYGQPVPAHVSRTVVEGTVEGTVEGMTPRRVAQWVAPDCTVTLSRWAFGTALRLTIESTRLAALARTADAQALVLDARDGPRRDAARLAQEDTNRREALEKTRTTNKATFLP